jgi:hypothetical protein
MVRQLLARKLKAFRSLSIIYEGKVTDWSWLSREPCLEGKTVTSVYRMPKSRGEQYQPHPCNSVNAVFNPIPVPTRKQLRDAADHLEGKPFAAEHADDDENDKIISRFLFLDRGIEIQHLQ